MCQKDFLEEEVGWRGRLVRHQQLGSLTRPSCPQAAAILQQTAEYIFSLEQEDPAPAAEHTAQALHPGSALPSSCALSLGVGTSGL